MEGVVCAVSAPDPEGADDRAKRNRTINASRAPALPRGNPMSVVLRRVVLGLVACAFAAGLGAQPAPGPPLRILVGFAAGGTTDFAARALAAELTVSLDRPVVVDNRPGASGRIAASALRHAPPDGATVMLAPMVVTVLAPLLWERPGYEPARDFAPVAHVAGFAIAIAVGSNVPARSITEFAAWAKDAPGGASYGVSAAGGLPHLFAELVGRTAGIDWVAVPYRGLAPLEVDLVGGRLPAAVDALSNLIELHRGGRARILAVSGEHALASASRRRDVPRTGPWRDRRARLARDARASGDAVRSDRRTLVRDRCRAARAARARATGPPGIRADGDDAGRARGDFRGGRRPLGAGHSRRGIPGRMRIAGADWDGLCLMAGSFPNGRNSLQREEGVGLKADPREEARSVGRASA